MKFAALSGKPHQQDQEHHRGEPADEYEALPPPPQDDFALTRVFCGKGARLLFVRSVSVSSADCNHPSAAAADRVCLQGAAYDW
ncbi:hypothetical protein [Rhizobium sp. No.120]